jgi:hypothetical protein
MQDIAIFDSLFVALKTETKNQPFLSSFLSYEKTAPFLFRASAARWMW